MVSLSHGKLVSQDWFHCTVLTHSVEDLGEVGEHVWHEILQHLVEPIQVFVQTYHCVLALNVPLGLLQHTFSVCSA